MRREGVEWGGLEREREGGREWIEREKERRKGIRIR